MKKTGQQLYWNLSESISRENNSSTNLEAIFTTLALLAVELGADEFQVELIRVCLGLQKITHEPESTLPTLLRYQIQVRNGLHYSFIIQLFICTSIDLYPSSFLSPLMSIHLQLDSHQYYLLHIMVLIYQLI